MNPDRRRFYEERGLLTGEKLGTFLATCAGYWPDRELIGFEGARYSYRDVWRWTVFAAQDLTRRGVRPGDRILLQMANSIEFLVLQFAVWRIGAVSVPVVPIYRKHELSAIIAELKPQVIGTNGRVGSRRYCEEIDETLRALDHAPLLKLVVGGEGASAGWDRMCAAPGPGEVVSEEGLPKPAEAKDCSVILYTSGTTSAPKGAMLSGEAIVANGHAVRRVLGITEKDVALCATPLAHTSAFLMSVVLPMAAGGRATVMPTWKPDQAIEVIAREGVTFMGAPPLILLDLVERYEVSPPRGSKISKFFCGGGGMTPSLIKRADAVGIKASRNYGMTETTGACAMSHLDHPVERRAYFDARAFFGTEMQIVDADRQPVAPGTIGEIRIRSPQMMIGYTDPALTEAQVDEEGWFYTGDLGQMDAEGWLLVVGRLKDIINRGGEKFSTQDIEAAVASNPDIQDVAVVGAPDKRFGEVVAAFIRLRPEVIWHGPEEILRCLEAAQLAKQKFPVQWHVVDELPRTASGKVQKQKLRERLWRDADG